MKKYILGGLVVIVCLASAVLANGFLAPLAIHYSTTLSGPPQQTDPTNRSKPFVGLALSGGGARAAVFAAAGMQALEKRGLLEQVTHVSSVSGGGFAASYLALHPLPTCGSYSDTENCTAPYFDEMQRVMAHDYFWDVEVNQLRSPARLLSPSRRLNSLQDALNGEDFLMGQTFEAMPEDRIFYFNAVSYDSGQRFVFSNGTLPSPDDPQTSSLPPSIRALSFSSGNIERSTPKTMAISLAVATSAAFPPYLGPTTIQINDSYGAPKAFWHLGDGGVLENSGVETLREAVHGREGASSATIYSFNAGQRLDKDLSRNTHDISIWSRDVARVVDVLLEYSGAHRETLSKKLDEAADKSITVIEFDYLDVARLLKASQEQDEVWNSWDRWQHCTVSDRGTSKSPAEHLAKIPTALRISACNRELIAAAASFLVETQL